MQTFKKKQSQKPTTPTSPRPKTDASKPDNSEHSILHLQGLIGNQAVNRIVQTNVEKTESDGRVTRSSSTEHNITHAPAGLLFRDGPNSADQARKAEETRKFEEAKKTTIQKHTDQQRKVADLLNKARKLQPDPKKDYNDPDALFRNTVELIDKGKITLAVLSPTHISPTMYFDARKKFDSSGSNFGGDYSRAVADGFEGIVEEKGSAFGKVNVSPPPAPLTMQTLPPKEERAPGETAPEKPKPAPTLTPQTPTPFSPGEIFYFTHGIDITEDQFKNTIVHEGQHVADLSSKKPVVTTVDDVLDRYKSEFRAFWIQPPLPRKGDLGVELIDSLPEPKGKAKNDRKVTIPKGKVGKICKPTSASAPNEFKTDFKNPRQEEIFWYLLSNYPDHEFDCCYVYDQKFRDEVNAFAFPASVNLINSARLMDLNLEIQKLNSSMKLAQVTATHLVSILTQLDIIDWKFLDDPKLSQPFWDALKNFSPQFVDKAVHILVKKGTKTPVSAAEVNKALK